MKKKSLIRGLVALSLIGFRFYPEQKKEPVSVQKGIPRDVAQSVQTKAKRNAGPQSEREWKALAPELREDREINGSADYTRTFRMVGRDLSKATETLGRLSPHTPEGLEEIKKAIGLTDKAIRLSIKRDYPPEPNGMVTTRLNVSRNDILLFGSEVIVNQTPRAGGLSEEIVADVISYAPSSLSERPKLSVEIAYQEAKNDARETSGFADLKTNLLSAQAVYFPGSKTLNLAWNLLVETQAYDADPGHEPKGKWNYVIDAATGAVLLKANEVHTETVFQASGKGGNSLNPKYFLGVLDVVYNLGSRLFEANTSRLETRDLKKFTSKEKASVISGSYPFSNFGNTPGNNAHAYAENVLSLLGSFGYNSVNGKGLKLVSYVNYSSNYANAFWDGYSMNYGDGGSDFYSLDSDIGVVGHEINHGFTQYHSALIYSGQSGGLNESFSDLAGVASKFFSGHLMSSEEIFKVGEKVVRLTGRFGSLGYLRNMCDPSRDGFSIDHLSQYRAGINVHSSSGIMNKAFCRFSKRLASQGNPDGIATKNAVLKAAKLFFHANKTQWTSSASFSTAAVGTVNAARNLGFSDQEIGYLRSSWLDVGVDPGSSP